jgi:hypothetical protein
MAKPGPSHPEPSQIQKLQYGLSVGGVQPYDIPASVPAGVQNIHMPGLCATTNPNSGSQNPWTYIDIFKTQYLNILVYRPAHNNVWLGSLSYL